MQLKSPDFDQHHHRPAASSATASIASSVSSSVGNLASKTAAGLVNAFSNSASAKPSASASAASRTPATAASKPHATSPSTTRPPPVSSLPLPASSRLEVTHAPKLAVADLPDSLPPSDGAQVKGPSFAAVSELAEGVTFKVQKAIDVLESSLDFDDLLKVNDALSQLQDVKAQLMEWLPKAARARGLPHVVQSHAAREAAQVRSSVSAIDDDPLA